MTRVKNVFSGIRQARRGERSFRAQARMGLVAVIFSCGGCYRFLVCPCYPVTLVLAAELANSSIEALDDQLHPEQHPAIGKVKDMAAGMVLTTSVAAVIVAILAIWSAF